MTYQLYSAKPAPPNPLLDLNLIMNLNPKIIVHDDMNDAKHRQTAILYESVLFEPFN